MEKLLKYSTSTKPELALQNKTIICLKNKTKKAYRQRWDQQDLYLNFAELNWITRNKKKKLL